MNVSSEIKFKFERKIVAKVLFPAFMKNDERILHTFPVLDAIYFKNWFKMTLLINFSVFVSLSRALQQPFLVISFCIYFVIYRTCFLITANEKQFQMKWNKSRIMTFPKPISQQQKIVFFFLFEKQLYDLEI